MRDLKALPFALLWLIMLTIGAISVPFWGDPLHLDLGIRLSPPGTAHLLGTDELGRDILIRLCYGARFTLLVTIGATSFSLILGFLLGSVAGWFGGILDMVINNLINLFWSVPFVVFAVLLIAIVGANATTLILSIGMINWVSSARVFRAETLRLRRSDFVTSARATGFGPMEIFFFQLLPNLKATWVGLLGYGAAETVTLESGLAFLGLSLPPPMATWGGMMADGLQLFSAAWWVAGMPAITVTITLVSFRILSESWGDIGWVHER